MSDVGFISKFIAESAAKGIDAKEIAKQEIQSIDEALNKAEELKVRRMKLCSVLDHLGDDTYRRRRTSTTQASEDIDIENNAELLKKIIDVVGEHSPIEVRDLINKSGGYDKDILIMRALKWLGDQEIVSRDSDRRVQPGKNWKKEI
jgi:hypothetical protein